MANEENNKTPVNGEMLIAEILRMYPAFSAAARNTWGDITLPSFSNLKKASKPQTQNMRPLSFG